MRMWPSPVLDARYASYFHQTATSLGQGLLFTVWQGTTNSASHLGCCCSYCCPYPQRSSKVSPKHHIHSGMLTLSLPKDCAKRQLISALPHCATITQSKLKGSLSLSLATYPPPPASLLLFFNTPCFPPQISGGSCSWPVDKAFSTLQSP